MLPARMMASLRRRGDRHPPGRTGMTNWGKNGRRRFFDLDLVRWNLMHHPGDRTSQGIRADDLRGVGLGFGVVRHLVEILEQQRRSLKEDRQPRFTDGEGLAHPIALADVGGTVSRTRGWLTRRANESRHSTVCA